jgi:hypothetical protein
MIIEWDNVEKRNLGLTRIIFTWGDILKSDDEAFMIEDPVNWRVVNFVDEMSKEAKHAPKGGVSIGGTFYEGGQFIPGDVIESATEEEKEKIEGKKDDVTPKFAELSNKNQENIQYTIDATIAMINKMVDEPWETMEFDWIGSDHTKESISNLIDEKDIKQIEDALGDDWGNQIFEHIKSKTQPNSLQRIVLEHGKEIFHDAEVVRRVAWEDRKKLCEMGFQKGYQSSLQRKPSDYGGQDKEDPTAIIETGGAFEDDIAENYEILESVVGYGELEEMVNNHMENYIYEWGDEHWEAEVNEFLSSLWEKYKEHIPQKTEKKKEYISPIYTEPVPFPPNKKFYHGSKARLIELLEDNRLSKNDTVWIADSISGASNYGMLWLEFSADAVGDIYNDPDIWNKEGWSTERWRGQYFNTEVDGDKIEWVYLRANDFGTHIGFGDTYSKLTEEGAVEFDEGGHGFWKNAKWKVKWSALREHSRVLKREKEK